MNWKKLKITVNSTIAIVDIRNHIMVKLQWLLVKNQLYF